MTHNETISTNLLFAIIRASASPLTLKELSSCSNIVYASGGLASCVLLYKKRVKNGFRYCEVVSYWGRTKKFYGKKFVAKMVTELKKKVKSSRYIVFPQTHKLETGMTKYLSTTILERRTHSYKDPLVRLTRKTVNKYRSSMTNLLVASDISKSYDFNASTKSSFADTKTSTRRRKIRTNYLIRSMTSDRSRVVLMLETDDKLVGYVMSKSGELDIYLKEGADPNLIRQGIDGLFKITKKKKLYSSNYVSNTSIAQVLKGLGDTIPGYFMKI